RRFHVTASRALFACGVSTTHASGSTGALDFFSWAGLLHAPRTSAEQAARASRAWRRPEPALRSVPGPSVSDVRFIPDPFLRRPVPGRLDGVLPQAREVRRRP